MTNPNQEAEKEVKKIVKKYWYRRYGMSYKPNWKVLEIDYEVWQAIKKKAMGNGGGEMKRSKPKKCPECGKLMKKEDCINRFRWEKMYYCKYCAKSFPIKEATK